MTRARTEEVSGWHADLLAGIRGEADTAYRKGSLKVAPTSQRVHGIRTPGLRRLAREWCRANRDAGPEAALTLVESLWAAESRDERMLGLEILRLHPRAFLDLEWNWFDSRRTDIDNWGVCDFLATGILGPWTEANPADRLPYLEGLVGDPHLYSRRLGLVASVPLNRGSARFGQWTLKQIDKLLDDRDPMITRAVSWSLREMTRHQAEEVALYVESRGKRLAALPRREVLNKLRTGRKSGRPS